MPNQPKDPLAPREYADNKSDAQKFNQDKNPGRKTPADDDEDFAGMNNPHYQDDQDDDQDDFDDEALDVDFEDQQAGQAARREGNPAVHSRDNQRKNPQDQRDRDHGARGAF
ncbi:MAG TPA: hypothetical protein PLO23_00090 [Alphaproteobacteria bacterium]|nr:hypothetical protein [Alphaproteobacteria bacterium]